MATPLDVLANLSMVANGEDVRVHADGGTVVVELSSFRAGTSLLSLLPLQGREGAQHLARLSDALRAADLTVEVRVRGDVIARLGAKAQAGSASRLLSLGEVEVRPGRAVVGAARRKPRLAWAVGTGVLGVAALLYVWRRG